MDRDWILYSFVPWTAKPNRGHHLVRALRERAPGDRFLWVDPPGPRSGEVAEDVAPGVRRVPTPGGGLRSPLVQQAWGRSLRGELASWRRPESPLVSWVQAPELSTLALSLPATTRIYDALDDWRHLPRSGPRLEAGERTLARRSDRVVAASEPIVERFARLGVRAELLPNACWPSDWARDLPIDAPPRFVYCGGIAEGFDVLALEAAARAIPHARWELVGPCAVPSLQARLERIPGVTLLGKRDYAELPELVARAAVCLLPFLPTGFNRGRDCLKLYEYLAAGRPVASTALPQAERLRDLVCVAEEGPAGFAAACARALADDTETRRQARRATVATETWPARGARLAQLIHQGVSA